MTCRSLLWIAAAAMSAAAGASSAPGALAAPDLEWTITVDAPAAELVTSKHLTIEGTASGPVALPSVIVTVVPQGLPPQCASETGVAQVGGDDRYTVELVVECNGPYLIGVIVQGPSGSASAEPRMIGVSEPPPAPAPPGLTVTSEGGLKATWEPPLDDSDAVGSILMVNAREDHFAVGVGEATLPPADRGASVALRSVRWGAGGPGTRVFSPESDWTFIAEVVPSDGSASPTGPEPPPSEAPAVPPHPPSRGRPSGSTTPLLPTEARPDAATTSTTAPPPTTAAVRPADALARAVVAHAPAPDVADGAMATAAPTDGLVRTTDEPPPGPVWPLATVVVAVCIAARLAWIRRRSRLPEWS